ncbi:hypothetical protein FACS1894190_09090 [Spirochaetia bacterium]|nr:hypothetical protein FACS1894190_09090 [Spirochaetia bacterium]
MRQGEIMGLQVQDLGPDCLYVRHSFNSMDKLKVPKNGETRQVELPFTDLIQGLFELAQKNPWGVTPESFIFWTERRADAPMTGRHCVDGLREALEKAGFSKEAAAGYMFHGWRHFYTSYMIEKLGKKLLKSQTGHRTDTMLSLYGDHTIAGDREKIQIAATETFGALIPSMARAG